jgi:hypothetical protein
MLQQSSEPPQFRQHGHVRLRYDSLPQNPPPDVLGYREVAHLGLFFRLPAFFFGHPKTDAGISFDSWLFTHNSSPLLSLL